MFASCSAVMPPLLFAVRSDPALISASTAARLHDCTLPTSAVVPLSGSFVLTSALPARSAWMTSAASPATARRRARHD